MTRTTDGVLDDRVSAELLELADVLAAVGPDAWATPSLCSGWTVREVVAHVTMPARRGTPRVLLGLALCGFRWHSFADKAARRDARLSTERLLADLRSRRLAAWRPPGNPEGALVHAVVHALDVTVPLGVTRPVDPGRMVVVLESLATPASLEHFGVDLSGTRLTTVDVPWSHGAGRPVSDGSEAMVLALSGRAPFPGEPAPQA